MSKGRPYVCTFDEVYDSDSIINGCDPALNKVRILAEGDSWFSIGGHRLSNPWFSNILFSLRFTDAKNKLILNLAEPADTISNMSKINKDRTFKDALDEHANHPWHAILLSGGGNDLLNESGKLMINFSGNAHTGISKPEHYCIESEIIKFLNNIEGHYKRIANLRSDNQIPIIVHTYDYPTPRNSPAYFFGIRRGPWICKALNAKNIPQKDWIAVTNYLYDRLADSLLNLPNLISNFHVVDTRNTVIPAKLNTTGASGDWRNEFHLGHQGCKKIAQKIEKKLESLGIK